MLLTVVPLRARQTPPPVSGITPPATIRGPKGFDKKLYTATYALYATGANTGVTTPRFLCTVTAIQKYKAGYIFLGAGHCTQANPELQADLVFTIETDLHTAPQSVELIKAVLQDENFSANQVAIQPVDYALFYLKTAAKIPTITLGDESSLRIGSKTTNVNFSLALAKYVAPGIVSSLVARYGEASGFFGDQMFMSHGASGSAVVDTKTHQIVGIVIAGEDEHTVPAWIEPVSVINAQLYFLNFDQLIAHPDIPVVERMVTDDYDMVQLLPATPNRLGASPDGSPTDSSTAIPAGIFAARFGPAHPFTLIVKGPDPTFTRAGYTFHVDIFGYKLSDDYYYNVPVFIGQDSGGYRLVSTKDNKGYSVRITLVGKTLSLLNAGYGGHGSSRGDGGRATPPAGHNERPHEGGHPGARGSRHEGGRTIDRDTREHYFGQSHLFRPEIRYNSGFYSFYYAGLWFDFVDEYPFGLDEDVFVDIGPDGAYYMTSLARPLVRIVIWVP